MGRGYIFIGYNIYFPSLMFDIIRWWEYIEIMNCEVSMFISVSEVAKKFNISKRRVQMLCEQGRVDGAIMVDGVWQLPKDVKKPKDARKKIAKKTDLDICSDNKDDFLTIDQVCDILSISQATVKNWVKLGKLESVNNGNIFRKKSIETLIQDIKELKTDKLQKRRNKKGVTGKQVYKNYIKSRENIKVVEEILNKLNGITEDELKVILLQFSLQIYNQCCGKDEVLDKYLNVELKNDRLETFDRLLLELINEVDFKKVDFSKLETIFEYKLQYKKFEDTLGFLYLSLRDLSNRKQEGVYYTPAEVVDNLIERVAEVADFEKSTFCDPCCGTGNFIIGLLKRGVSINNLFGQDIDNVGVCITKINVFLLNQQISIDDLNERFLCVNTLFNDASRKFSVLLGNPPWGVNFSKKEKSELEKVYYCAQQKGIESYDLFIEKGLKMLEDSGFLSFVLPEAVLNVLSHEKIREIILKQTSFKFLQYLGNVFSGVQCPSIIFGVCKDGLSSTKNCKVIKDNNEFTISADRKIDSSQFDLGVSDEEYECIQKIESNENVKYLHNNAKFALGIVTGDNKKHIKKNHLEGCEIILKGNDIFRYNVKENDNFIEFTPDKFQQVAPVETYRAEEKILYRFISNTPVFAYDDKQRLSLNSCNILIPKIENMKTKYILAILNSRAAAFYIMKKFNSFKVLKSHIEALPIPVVDDCVQDEIINLVDEILEQNGDVSVVYERIDEIVMGLYNLSSKHRNIIIENVKIKDLC